MQKGTDQDAVAQILDHLVFKRPDSDFPKFCECLKKSEQGHILEKYFSGTCYNISWVAYSYPLQMFVENVALPINKLTQQV